MSARQNHGVQQDDALIAAVEQGSHLLPVQGPIGVFIHHNTLHAFESLSFHEAVIEGEKVFGGRPYLEEETFRELMKRGRINERDLERAYQRIHGCVLGSEERQIGGVVTQGALRRMLLIPGLRAAHGPEVALLLHEAGAEADERTFERAFSLVAALSPALETPAPFVRHRDALVALHGIDTDEWVHPPLIRYAAAFLDGPTAYWPMPSRELGFYRAVRDLEAQKGILQSAWSREVSRVFADLARRDVDALTACYESLDSLGVERGSFEPFVHATLAPLRGYAGIFRKLEQDADPHAAARPALLDWLAVRLVYDRCAVLEAAKSVKLEPPALLKLRRAAEPHDPRGDAYLLYQLFRALGAPSRFDTLEPSDAAALLKEVRAFGDLERRRVWQEAYELHYIDEVAGAIASHSPFNVEAPRFQVMTCLDEREESFRRHIEEIEPRAETIGAAGFFGLPVDYRGIDDAHATSRCPVVVVPDREIHEHPLSEDVALLEDRKKKRRLTALLSRELGASSRMLVRGAAVNAIGGWLAAVPMALRVLFPHWSARLQRAYRERYLPKPRTRLAIDPKPHHHDDRLLLGLPEQERIDRVAGFLESIGLTRSFSPLVLVLGHGSTSLNNPHESAHDCGACGGRHGGPSARLFAHLCNDANVRAGLVARGIQIPGSTWFVGGEHDTCTDAVVFWDQDTIPESHSALFQEALGVLDKARAQDAHERCRRFDVGSRGMTPERALLEVERRASAYDEPRPEYGHATNAFAVVGRRSRTRGLFLDRRAFLVSYDPAADPTGDVLVRVLAAAGPVCAGINLEYYFSSVDNERYGCGTKLPHNVTAGLGIMNGAASDLRTGLPWQMVEIHEPVRLTMIVEQTRDVLLRVLDRVPNVKALVEREWIRIAVLDPVRERITLLSKDGSGEPIREPASKLPVVERSADHYTGHQGHLGPARVLASTRNGARREQVAA